MDIHTLIQYYTIPYGIYAFIYIHKIDLKGQMFG